MKNKLVLILFLLFCVFLTPSFSADDIEGGLEKLSLGENSWPHEELESRRAFDSPLKFDEHATTEAKSLNQTSIRGRTPQQEITLRKTNHGGATSLVFKEGSIEFSDPHYTYNPRGRKHVTFLAKIDKEITNKKDANKSYKVTTIEETWNDAISKYGGAKKLASVRVYFDSKGVHEVRVKPSLGSDRKVEVADVYIGFIKEAIIFIGYVLADVNGEVIGEEGKIIEDSEAIKYIHGGSFKDFTIEVPRK
jgi:hypothetical protein